MTRPFHTHQAAEPAPVPARSRRATTAWRRALLAALLLPALVVACSDSQEASGAAGGGPVTLPGGDSGATTSDDSDSDSSDPDGSAPDDDGEGDAESDATAGGAATSDWIGLPLQLVTVAELVQPTVLTTRPGSEDLWIAERTGRIRRVERTVDDEARTEELRLVPDPVLDLSDQISTEGEGGLLGLVFSADGDRFYVDYTDSEGDTVVSSFAVDGDTVSAEDEQVLLTVDQPYSNHNGGDLQIGPDGYLYIALGDGGSADDPHGHGQDTSTLLGSLLRIEPSPGGEAPYLIPPDNPFVDDDEARPEIWLYGARNPWRFTFDAETGDLWVGDVGQNEVEEIDHLPAADGGGRGANLGWNLMEGNEPFAGDEPADHVGPIHTYSHEAGACSVTGGHVYRGDAIPQLDGVYLFSDYCTGGIAGIQLVDGGEPVVAPLTLEATPLNVVSFGVGPDGESYVLEQGGRVSRIKSPESELAVTVRNG